MVIRSASVVAFVCLLAPPPTPAQLPSQLKARVLAEYPPALEQLARGLSQVRGTGRLEMVHTGGTHTSSTTSSVLRFAITGGLRKVERTWDFAEKFRASDEAAVKTDQVFCRNATSSFSLSKYDHKATYTIAGFSSRDDVMVDEMLKMGIDQFIGASYAVFGIPVQAMMAEPNFSIRGVTRSVSDGKETLKIEYDYKSREFRLTSGYLVVSPADGWRILLSENNFGLSTGERLRTVVEYGVLPGLEALPSRVTVSQPGGVVRKFELNEAFAAPSAASEFTLPYFGLPDLERPPAAQWGVSVTTVLLVSFVACGLAALAIKRRSVRITRAL